MDAQYRPDGTLAPSDYEVDRYNEGLLTDLYRTLRKIREFELAAKELMDDGEFPGPVHLYLGQEAVATGACQALDEDDIIGSTHRGHGHVLAKGADPKAMMAELGAKETGPNGGRGGSMHMVDFSKGIFGTNGIVGASVPHVTGGVLAGKMDGTDQVGIAFFGDGGSNQGVVWETVNLASLWDIPVIFLCENNRYAESTPFSKVTAGPNIAARADGYGIDGQVVDGQNVLTVYDAFSEAVENAHENQRPQFIEVQTYRLDGHFSGEEALFKNRDRHYRAEEEAEEWWEKQDPVESYREALEHHGVLSESGLSEIDAEYEALIDEAVEEMLEADHPPAEDTMNNVYTNQDYPGLPAHKYR